MFAMTLVNAYEMSRLWMIFLALYASYASCTLLSDYHWHRTEEAYQQEREDDTSKEEPTTDAERDIDTAIGLVLGAGVEDGVGP